MQQNTVRELNSAHKQKKLTMILKNPKEQNEAECVYCTNKQKLY